MADLSTVVAGVEYTTFLLEVAGGKVHHWACCRCGHRTLRACSVCAMPVCSVHFATHLCLPGKWAEKARQSIYKYD